MTMTQRALACTAVLFAAGGARADDWPQWMGPKRDNVWREAGVVDKFPAGGPKVLWRAAVAGGKVFVADYVSTSDVKVDNFARKEFTGTERVLCLDEKAGKELWKYEYPVKYSISYPAGPRCTPTVDGNLVYTLGAEGNLVALDAATGKPAWAHDLKAEYKTKSALWGYASHPLIDGKKLITLVGGEDSHVVAFDKETGKEIWRSQTQQEQGYCPVLITEAGGVRQLIVVGTSAVRGLDPETGSRYWTTPYEATNGGVIMTPIRFGDYLYVGGYQGKNLLLKLAADKPAAEVVFKDKRKAAISPINVQPFLDKGTLYGYHEDGTMFAVDVPTGKRLWESGGPVGEKPVGSGTAFIVRHGDRYFFFTETGDLVIGKLTPEGYEELDRAKKVIEPTNNAFGRKVVWCPPAFANKHMYVRNDKEVICVDLAK